MASEVGDHSTQSMEQNGISAVVAEGSSILQGVIFESSPVAVAAEAETVDVPAVPAEGERSGERGDELR